MVKTTFFHIYTHMYAPRNSVCVCVCENIHRGDDCLCVCDDVKYRERIFTLTHWHTYVSVCRALSANKGRHFRNGEREIHTKRVREPRRRLHYPSHTLITHTHFNNRRFIYAQTHKYHVCWKHAHTRSSALFLSLGETQNVFSFVLHCYAMLYHYRLTDDLMDMRHWDIANSQCYR